MYSYFVPATGKVEVLNQSESKANLKESQPETSKYKVLKKPDPMIQKPQRLRYKVRRDLLELTLEDPSNYGYPNLKLFLQKI